MKTKTMAILEGDNLEVAVSRGLVSSEARLPANTTITIAGLNEMEHRGSGSALIHGIVISAERTGGSCGASRPAAEETEC